MPQKNKEVYNKVIEGLSEKYEANFQNFFCQTDSDQI